ncbi:MAG: hypothetical protein JWN78_2102 [Bacteroidota bacterium]|nr:hypothetical protein [Bacteroidota bacterium]
MKKAFLFLFIGSFILCEAQNNKTITIDPRKAAEMKVKSEQMHPKPVKPPVEKTQKNTSANIKTQRSETAAEESKPSPTAKPFTFLGSFTMNFDEKNVQGKSNAGKIQYAFDGFQAAMVPSFVIRDVKSLRALVNAQYDEITMLTTDNKGKKSGLLMKRPKPVLATADPKKAAKAPLIKKTGETKIIQGYKCEKLLVTYPDSTNKIKKIESWVTADLALNTNDLITMANAGFKGKSPFGETNVSDVKGTALETNVLNRDGSEMKVTLTDIKKIKPAASLFTTDGFTITDIRGLPMFGGK